MNKPQFISRFSSQRLRPLRSTRTIIAALVALTTLAIVVFVVEAANRTWDGGATGNQTTLDSATSWVGDVLPVSTDEVLMDNSVKSPLPAQLTTTGASPTYGDLIWNTNDTSTITINTGTATSRTITLSGGGGFTAATGAGGSTNDLLLMGTNATSNSLTIGGNAGVGTARLALAIGADGNFDVVNSGATLTVTGILSGTFNLTKAGAGTLALSGVNTFGSGRTFTLSSGTLSLGNKAALGAGTVAWNGVTTSASTDLSGVNAIPNTGTFGATGNVFNGSNSIQLSGTLTNSVTSNTITNNMSGGILTLSGPFNLSDSSTNRTVTFNGSGNTVIGGVIANGSTSTSNLVQSSSATLGLSGVNTYSGTTTINSGTLALSGSGSIANSPSITIAGGARLDLSGLTTSLTLANGQALVAPGTTSSGLIAVTPSIGLTTASNTPLQFTAFNGSTAPLTISGTGTVTLASGNPVTVTVSGPALGVGNYTLISKGSGSVAGTAPSSVTVTPGGLAAGTAASLQITGQELVLHVAVAPKYRSRTSGNWNDFNTWDIDTGSGFVPAASGQTPTSADDTIEIQSPHTVTVTANVTVDQVTVDAGGTLATSAVLTNSGTNVNGTFQINDGGSITGTKPVYGGSSFLVYNTPGGYTTSSIEWDNFSGPGSGQPKNVTIQAGTVSANAPKSLNGNFNIAGGTFVLGGDLFLLGGNFSDSGSFNPNGSQVWFTGNVGPQTITKTNGTETFDRLISNQSGGSTGVVMNCNLTINGPVGTTGLLLNTASIDFLDLNGFTLTLGGNTDPGQMFVGIGGSGALKGSSASNLVINGSGTLFGGLTFASGFRTLNNLTINRRFGGNTGNQNGTVAMNTDLTVNGLLEVVLGTFTSSTQYHDVQIDNGGTLALSGPISVNGNWTLNTGGTFTPGSNGVTFNGATGQTITGNTSFYDLTKSVAAAQQFNFAASSLTTVTHALTLNGATGNLLTLRSTSGGTPWLLHAPATQTVDFVDAKDSNATGGVTVTATHSINSGNNTNWVFTQAAVVYVDPTFTGAPGTDPDGPGPATSIGYDAFATIQGGIDGVAASGTVNVAAGTYAENVLVNKSVSVLGPNAIINPNTGVRVAEAIVVPAVVEIEPATSGTVFRVGSGSGHVNVTIKGLTIDGHNASLSGGRMLNGVMVDTGAGIINSTGSFDSNPGAFDTTMIVQNNIIQNLERYGVLVDNTPARPGVTGNDVSFNKIDNLPSGNLFGGGRGRGIAFEENAYGSATFNVMTRVNVGWQDDNFNLASPGAGTVIDHNTIHTYHRGIFHNLQYQNASDATITNNDLFVETTGDFAASATNFGLELATIQSAVGATVTGNNSTGNVYGIVLWNLPTTANIVVTGGTLSGNQIGVWATSNDPQFGAGAASHSAISGVTITGATTAGVEVQDNPALAATALEISGNTSISTSARGVAVVGAAAAANIHNNSSSIHDNTVGILVDNGSATITSNNLFANGTSLQFLNGGTSTAHFNRIISTTTAIANPDNLTPNLENNWWGCNAGPGNAGCGAVTGTGADFNPWIVLLGSATPGTISPGGQSTIAADMTHNSDGNTPVGTLPNIADSFSATNGTMNPTTGTVIAGADSSLFTSTNSSNAVATITVDNANVDVPITVTAPSFTIDDVTHNEGNGPGTTSYVFTVTKTGATTFSSSVNFTTVDGTATQPSDYTLNSGTLNFTAVQTTQQITVLVNGDLAVELNEAFTVHLSTAVNATISDADGTGTITNDDTCPAFATVYVDDNWIGTTPGTDPDSGGPATNFGCDSFATIQEGVNAVTSGGTVIVRAGTYAESVLINKALTLNGAQVGANANTRFAAFTGGPDGPKANPAVESIITAAAVNPGSNINNSIHVDADNVTVDGFVVDGNNPALAQGSAVVVGGINTDVRRGIETEDGAGTFFAANNAQIKNNVVQNFAQRGIEFVNGLDSGSAPATTGGLITGNVIRNFLTTGIELAFNSYTDVTSNTVTGNNLADACLMIQDYTNTSATPRTINVSNNTFTVGQDSIGVWANLMHAPGVATTAVNVSTNTINPGAAVTATSDLTFGIYLTSLQAGTTATLTGNIVGASGGQFARGIALWNLPTTTPTAVTGGTIGLSVKGVSLHDNDPNFGLAGSNSAASISGVSIDGTGVTSGIGIFVDAVGSTGDTVALEISGNTSIINTATAISVTGTNASANIHDNAASIHDNTVGIDVNGGSATITGNNLYANVTSLRFTNGATGTAHFNRIISTTTAIANPDNLTPNLENNWWGCNAGPGNAGCGAVTGTGADFNPWIVLLGSATPSTISPGGASTIAADMTHNFPDNVVPSGTLPNIPDSYSATNGTMNPTTGTVIAGAASSVFTSTNSSNAVATITVDNANVDVPITVTAPSFTIDDVTHNEGDAGTTAFTFTITKTGATALSSSVDYATVNGTATAPSDFTAILTTNVVFGPLETTKPVTVLVNGDTAVEPPEAFTVHLSNASGATIADADGLGTITNDDVCPLFATVYVDDDWAGTTLGADPDGPGPATSFGCDSFATIQDGINGVTPGGTVIVAAGTYTQAGSINLNKSLILQGPNSAISPNGGVRVAEALITGAVSPVLRISLPGNPVTIEGFKFDNTGVVDAYDPALNITIRRNIYSNGTSGGAFYFLNGPAQLTIDDNHLTNAVLPDNDALFVAGNWNGATGTVASITNNVFENTPTAASSGMNLSNVSGTISGNRITNLLYYGILLANNSSSMTISNNVFDGIVNPDPVNVPSWGAGVRTFTPSFTGPVNIKSNTFKNSYTGVGVRGVPNDPGADITGMDIHVNFNRFINNTFGISDGAAGTLDAENNWWGCNYGPGTGGAGCSGTPNGVGLNGAAIVDANPWLVLGVSAAPSSITPFSTSTITADMTHNSATVDTSGSGTVPPTPVAFSATQGTMAPPTGTTTAGQATSVFTSTSADPGTSCATVDNQLSCTNIPLLPTSVTISPAGGSPTATDNDYTRINNAVQAASSGSTITLSGTFNWTEPNAAASWALGSDGISQAGGGDDYSIVPPPNRNNVTLTAANLGAATIQGPGDLAAANLEGVIQFYTTATRPAGNNQNWTISNIRFLDFDLSIGFFNDAAANTNSFGGTQILNNYIRVAQDLNATVAPADVSQNIGIHYSFGKNQVISGNTIEIQGNAVSDGSNFASDVGMQCNTSGGDVYDGLQITNNIIRVLHAQSPNPEVIIGIWENAHGHSSNITVSGNTFTNQDAGNSPAANLQRGFRVTSHSSPTSTVTYQNNTVSGANLGFQWIDGSTFGGNLPVVVKSNTITGNGTGVLVQSQGLANLSFNRIVGNTVTGLNNVDGTVTAENNWWGCNAGPGGSGCDTVTGTADFDPWIVLGVSALPNSLIPGGTSAITADMTLNSGTADTSGSGTVPLIPVAFSAAEGTMAPPTGTITAGQAVSTFTSTSGLSGSACATVDNQLICTPITVDAPTFAIGDVSQVETDSGTTDFIFTVTRTGNTALASVVDYSTVDGSATAPSDFNAIANGQITIPANQPSGTITVQVKGDTTYEADEQFTVHLNSVTNGTITGADGLGTITNDDPIPLSLVVTKTADTDDGFCTLDDCSLREAISNANTNPDTNTISFNIDATTDSGCNGGAGPCTISPQTNLPQITSPVVIDGFTQPGASVNTDPTGIGAHLLIELEGSNLSDDGIGLDITAGNSTVKGLVINRFTGSVSAGIRLSALGGNTITGNFIGTDAAGIVTNGNEVGVLIDDVPDNIIGGPITDSVSAAARNLISANWDDGVLIIGANARRNKVQGNFIGTDASGASIEDDESGPIGNGLGIEIIDGQNNIIGNSEVPLAPALATGAGNVISGNLVHGIEISSADGGGPRGNGVGSNFIGTDLTGTLSLPNGFDGVELCQDSQDNLVGGITNPAFGNVIAHNGFNGVTVLDLAVTGNTVRLNSIFENTFLGIDLGGDGQITPNDPADADTGPPNLLQNFPDIKSAVVDATSTISGILNSTPGQTFKLDFYSNAACDESGNGEGQTYLGSLTTNTTNGNGDVGFRFNFSSPTLNPGDFVTATATDSSGNTSEFSKCFQAVPIAKGQFRFAQANTDTPEGNSPNTHDVSIAVQRVNGADRAVAVDYAITNGTATTADNDYSATGGTLHWANGDVADKFITITVNGDATYESDETVNLTLSNPTNGATLGSPGAATLTITNDDAPPSFTINDISINEGTLPAGGTTSFTFTVTKAGPTEVNATVGFATADGVTNPATGNPSPTCSAGFDYQSQTGSLSFAPTDTTKTITVLICRDAVYEANETFFVNLSGATDATIADNQGLGTIQNEDSPGTTVVVNTTADHAVGTCDPLPGGDCTLREAIAAANAATAAVGINFDIPANDSQHFYYADDGVAGQVTLANVATTTAADDSTIPGIDPDWPHSWWSILPTSALPTVTQTVVIDGYSQTGATVNTLAAADNAVLRIELNGASAGASVTGLSISGPITIARGLAINRFTLNGINPQASGTNITGSFIGTDVSGTLDLGNTGSGISSSGSSLGIGGTSAALANLISGNDGDGIALTDSNSDLIQGNYIGTKPNGTSALGNGGSGVSFSNGGSVFNTIGGANAGEGNTIAFNGVTGGDGVRLETAGFANAVRGNSIFSNGSAANDLGIDLGTDGVTANDAKDPDSGPNNLQNFPVITSALVTGSTKTITGTLNSTVGETFTIDFYQSGSCDTSGNGEGQTYLGSTTTGTTDANGDVSFTFHPSTLTIGQVVTATATSTSASFSTSEFSACFMVTDGSSGAGDIQFASATYTVAENDASHVAVITFTRVGGTNGSVSATFTTADGTAHQPGDYTAVNQTVTFAEGATSQTVNVPIVDDSTAEANETVNLSLSHPKVINAARREFSAELSPVDPYAAVLTITNDDCPAAFTVDNNGEADDVTPGDGVCATAGAVCTLRAAIEEANASLASCGTININFSGVTSPISLNTALPDVDHNVNINGPGAAALTVQRSTAGATPNFRIFTINSGITVTISDLTISNGRTASGAAGVNGDDGGGILNNTGATLNLRNLAVRGNLTGGGGTGAHGGNGGGVYNSGTLTLTNSTVSGNTTGTSSPFDPAGFGGGVFNGGTLTLTNSTVSGNQTGDGIVAYGGGVYNGGTLTLTNSTVSNNKTPGNTGVGGGILNNSGTTNLRNTIVANNTAGSGSSASDLFGTFNSQDYNLIGDTAGSSISGTTTHNKTNVNALIGPLTDNGGPTQTHALLYNSPALDAGDDCVFTNTCSPSLGSALTTDQRGFSRQIDGDNNGTATVDIGAYERRFIEDRNVSSGSQVDLGDARLTFTAATVAHSEGGGTTGIRREFVGNTVSLNVIDPNAQGTPPAGYSIGNTFNPALPGFDVTPSSNFYTPPVSICFYLPSITDASFFAGLRVLHQESGVLVDPGSHVNFSSKTVCTQVSSFSAFLIAHTAAPTVANGSISGRITDANGAPVGGAVVTLSGTQTGKTITDNDGNYHFDDVEINGFYTVTPARASYAFSPATRSFSQLGNHTEAAFTAFSTGAAVNPLDTPEYFVRQHYLDFLGREPDRAGFNYWSEGIIQCNGEPGCIRARRIDVSAAFFIEQEFQQTGSFIYRLYKGALGRQLTYSEFSTDRMRVIGGPNLEGTKTAYVDEFVQRAEFGGKYQANTTADSFVDALLQSVAATGANVSGERANLIETYNAGTSMNESRSLVVRKLADNPAFSSAVYNQSFVLMQYFGYLRRNPDQGGYDFWLNVLDNGDRNNYRGMVCWFITSTEYQRRFSDVVTHGNEECSGVR